MLKKTIVIISGILVGVAVGFFLVGGNIWTNKPGFTKPISTQVAKNEKVVIGFLPFWLIDKASNDYSKYITQLSYFNLVINGDGNIQKFTKPGESDPGYHALFTGKIDSFLDLQRSKGVELSLTIFSGEDKKIDQFLMNPAVSAQNLINDISPILEERGFSDLNLDIEKVADATPSQRAQYTTFVGEVRKLLNPKVSITVDVPGIAFIKNNNLADPKSLAKVADYIVFMGYDFHNPGSIVTGPVSPQSGAGIVSEFDIESATQAALTLMPNSKLILAIPLYGYSWETINPGPRSATMPGSAYSISSRSIKELVSSCTNCKIEFDKTDSESHIIYPDEATGLYHQIFYPDKASTQIKVNFVKSYNLGGMALWALGYEDNEILAPLKDLRQAK